MHTLLISYDLIAPGRNYESIRGFLESHDWTKPVQSLYLIKTSQTAKELLDSLNHFLDPNDKVIVVDVTKNSTAWKGLADKASNWIKQNL